MPASLSRLVILVSLAAGGLGLAGCTGGAGQVRPPDPVSVLEGEVAALREETRSAGLEQQRLGDRMAALEQQMGRTATEVEETARAFKQMQGSLETLQESVRQMGQRLEAGALPEKPELTARTLNLQSLYSLAYAAHREGHLDEALQGFTSFLEAFPDALLADNARFHVAEDLARLGRHEEARAVVEALLAEGGEASMRPDALLLLGQLYEKALDPASAAVAYRRLLEDYPASFSAALAAARLERLGGPEPSAGQARGESGAMGNP